jgi:Arc/MetJ-type ribon-helix-helix transcriptional regulator
VSNDLSLTHNTSRRCPTLSLFAYQSPSVGGAQGIGARRQRQSTSQLPGAAECGHGYVLTELVPNELTPAERLLGPNTGGMRTYHTDTGGTMAAAKVAITIEEELLERIDRLVQQRRFPNRSRAIQEAVRDKLDRLERGRLARECAKLDRASERKMADEGLAGDLEEWPEF